MIPPKKAHKKPLDTAYCTKDTNVTYKTYEEFKLCTTKKDNLSGSFEIET